MLANPHNANVAIVKETGSSVGRMGPSCAYAMNSFSTMRVPSRLPIVPLSCHGTPITHAMGLKTQPSTVWMFSGNHAAYPWTQPKAPLARATSAMKETSIAITLSMRCNPSVVPRAAASTRFTSVRGMSTRTPPSVCGVSVSGSRILAIMMVPGGVQEGEQRRHEDDGGEHLKREDHAQARVLLADLPEHELRADVGEAQDLLHHVSQGAEQRLTQGHAQHEDREGELQPHSPGHDAPADRAAVARQGNADSQDQNDYD